MICMYWIPICVNSLVTVKLTALFYSIETTKRVAGLQLCVKTEIHKAAKQRCLYSVSDL